MSRQPRVPFDGVPVLSRGRHRSPRRGACFMEMASFLAGERWSDHPSCTHPLLAELARLVNDNTPDDERQLLAPMIPDVIGLNGTDLRIDVELALACAGAALPISSAERQRVLAVGVLAGERVLAPLEGRPTDSLRHDTEELLALAPDAWHWANAFARGMSPSHRGYRTQTAPRMVSLAVDGVATACVQDPSARLRAMLVDGIAIVERFVIRDVPGGSASAQGDRGVVATGGADDRAAVSRAG